MTFENLTWVLVAMSITGNVLVIKKNVKGQWLWAFANIGWLIYDISVGAYSQASLFALYFAMSVWGIISWTKEKKRKNEG